MSVASLLVIGERLFVYRKSNRESRTFAAKMGGILVEGDLDAAATRPWARTSATSAA